MKASEVPLEVKRAEEFVELVAYPQAQDAYLRTVIECESGQVSVSRSAHEAVWLKLQEGWKPICRIDDSKHWVIICWMKPNTQFKLGSIHA